MNSQPIDDDPRRTRRSILLRLRGDGSVREIAWNEFYGQYQPVVRDFAHRLGAGPAEAEEIVQDVMVGFFGVAPRFAYDPERGSLRSYLRTCAVHAVRARCRKRCRTLPVEALEGSEIELQARWDQSWQQHLLIPRAVDQLRNQATTPVQQRTFQAFELHSLHGWPMCDVMARLHMTEAAFRKAIGRSKARLRTIFEDLDALGW